MLDPLVLLPGMMCDERLFAPQIEAFSPSRQVSVLPLSGAKSIQEIAGLVLNDAPPKFALAGLSMGGIVAMEIMRLAPHRVTRLALLDTNPLPDPPERAPIRDAQVASVLDGGLKSVMRDEMKPNYLAQGPRREDVLALCMTMAEDLGPRVFEEQSIALKTRADQSETLKSVAVPSLVLCGREDRLCPVERHELMADLIPGGQLRIIDGAGHLPTLEQPDLCNEALDIWLSE